MPDTSVLDDPIRAALAGPHRRFAVGEGQVWRYHPHVGEFWAFPDELTDDVWATLARVAHGSAVTLRGVGPEQLPLGWDVEIVIALVQFDGSAVAVEHDDEAVELTAADVPEMLDLVARTKPGPFLPRTIELGTYLGIRRGGALIAMAGERLHPPGWTEISAVCTDPAFRGQGLAQRLIRAVGAVIRDRGDVPFLHTSLGNPAIALYERMGFELRSTQPMTRALPPRS